MGMDLCVGPCGGGSLRLLSDGEARLAPPLSFAAPKLGSPFEPSAAQPLALQRLTDGACPLRVKRVEWGEFSGEAPLVAEQASRKKGSGGIGGPQGQGIPLPRREPGSDGMNELSRLLGGPQGQGIPLPRREPGSDGMNELSRLRGSERYGVRDDEAAPGGERKGAYFRLQGNFLGFYSFLVWNLLSPFGVPVQAKACMGRGRTAE